MNPVIANTAEAERRRQHNRQAAAASRQKKRQYMLELEERVQQLSRDNERLTALHSLAAPLLSLSTEGHIAHPPLPVAVATVVSSSPASSRPPSSPTTAPATLISVAPLSSQWQHVDGTAALLYAEWANLYAFDNIHSAQQLADKLRTHNPPPSTASAAPSPLPATLVACDENTNELLGTASLDTSDLPPSHPYYSVTPWVSSVLVREQWRGRGVAGRLVRGVEAEARRRGLQWLWLWTTKPASVAMYEHLGWRAIEQVWLAEKAGHVTVMRKDLVDHTPPPHHPLLPSAPISAPPRQTQRRAQAQPSVAAPSLSDTERAHERLWEMVGSLEDYEHISEFTRVAALFAKGRLSVLDEQQREETSAREAMDSDRAARGKEEQAQHDENGRMDERNP